jgi:ribonuclease G
MTRHVLINAGIGEIRAALVVDGRLEAFRQERILGGQDGHIGDVILGRVQRVSPGMQAAFVDIGMARAGFLALTEARLLAKTPNEATGISDCVREGEAVLVQIIKDPVGEKGARLSAAIALPGRLLVMTPDQKGITVSRRIADAGRRAALLQAGEMLRGDPRLTPGAGFIFRTEAAGAPPDALTQDALALDAVWRGVAAARAAARPPATLYRDLGPVARILRDMVQGDVARVLMDDAGAAQAARDYCRRVMPDMEDKIELVREALFERDNLEDEIARLFQSRVALACGGWITIEATEALTAIDVNSGGLAGAQGLDETSLTVNLEAAQEIGRQIRLRGIGGLIVADFIQMSAPAHRERVLDRLSRSLGFDGVPVELSAMSAFGIVAITRKRQGASLTQATSQACPTCGGDGRVPAAETVGQEILRRLEREARAWPGRELVVTAAPSVAAWLNQPGVAQALAQRGISRVRFEAGSAAQEGFDVRPV